jgi:imidazolonepropionase-like amidohydrolase
MTLKVKVPLAWFGAGTLVHHAAVVCEGGRVTYAGPSAAAPPAAELLEVDGFLMPGVADRHVHIRLADPGAVLFGGVTAVRDLGWAPEEILALANASELPSFTGPVIRAAGPMLTAPGGYPTHERWAPSGTARELRGPEDAATVVAELADIGAAAVKVALNSEAGPTPSDAELAAIVQAAHERDLPVTAHVQGRGQPERAVGAGIDEFAHTPWTERLPDPLLGAAARGSLSGPSRYRRIPFANWIPSSWLSDSISPSTSFGARTSRTIENNTGWSSEPGSQCSSPGIST